MRWLVLLVVACRAAAPNPPLLKSADLLADLSVLETAYRTLHPGLERYAKADLIFADARREFDHDRSLGDAFVVLTRLTAAIRCGHSQPNPFNQTKEIAAALFTAPRLPLLFRWIGDDMVVTKSGRFAPGTIVKTLDGIPTRSILAALMPLARADGHNDAKRRAYLSDVLDSQYEAFDLLAPLVFPKLVAPTVTVNDVTVPMESFAKRSAEIVESKGALWKAREIGGVEYLAMPTWVAYKTDWDWKGDLQALFDHLDKPLVIDLRGNEGGSDVGDEIIAHLVDKPFMRDAFHRRVRFASVPEALRPVLDTWDPSFFTLGEDATPLADGWRELKSDELAIEPKAPRYRKKVIVLVDASNSSSTFQFALAVQRAKLATLVGEPTGGSQRGINGGAFFFVRLPRTHLEVDLPLIGTFPDGDAPEGGVTPDVVVPITADDIAHGRDRQLEKALELANQS